MITRKQPIICTICEETKTHFRTIEYVEELGLTIYGLYSKKYYMRPNERSDLIVTKKKC